MKLLRILAAGLFLTPLLHHSAAAQLLDPSFAPPTGIYAPGQVYALGPQQADGMRLVSGSFNRVNGTAVGGLVRVDSNGALDPAFHQNVGLSGPIFRIRTFPNGQYLLCGFGGPLTAGGVSRIELVRLNASGSGDATFDVGAGPVAGGTPGYGWDYAVQPDSKVVVVGNFDTFNNVPAAGVVRLNANGSVDTGFTVGGGVDVATEQVNAVVVQPDGKLLVGGTFGTFNGQPVPGLVRLNANGSRDLGFAPGLDLDSDIESLLLQPDGAVLVAGNLVPTGTTTGLGIVRLLPAGSYDASFQAPSFLMGGSVTTSLYDQPMQLQPDGKVLISGYFQGPGANGVARLNANGSQDLSFQSGSGTNQAPTTLGLQANGKVLVGGYFQNFSGVANPLVQLNSTGAVDPTFRTTVQLPGMVTAMVRQADGGLVLGGSFTEINGQAVNYLARLSDAGVLDLGFRPNAAALPNPVTALAIQADGKVLAGTGNGVLRFSSTGNPDPSYSTFSSNLGVRALALQPDGRLIVGGLFSDIGYQSVLRLTSAGTYDNSFVTPSPVGSLGTLTAVEAVLVQPDGRVVVGGQFRLPGQLPTAHVVRYQANGTLDPTFDTSVAFTLANGTSNSTNRIYSLDIQPDGRILVGGRFAAPREGVARLTATGALDAGFVPDAGLNGVVYRVLVQPNGRVLVGGQFTSSTTSTTYLHLTRLLDTGLTDPSFGTSAMPNASVRALLVQPDGNIVLAGSFTEVAGQPAFGVARIGAQFVLPVAAPAAVAARTSAWPVPAHDQLHVAPDFSAQPRSVELLDALGRQVRQQAVSGSTELTLDLRTLPAGLYQLRVRYAAGTVTRRIAVE